MKMPLSGDYLYRHEQAERDEIWHGTKEQRQGGVALISK